MNSCSLQKCDCINASPGYSLTIKADFFVQVSTGPFHCILRYSKEQLLNHSQLPGPRNKARNAQELSACHKQIKPFEF